MREELAETHMHACMHAYTPIFDRLHARAKAWTMIGKDAIAKHASRRVQSCVERPKPSSGAPRASVAKREIFNVMWWHNTWCCV